MKIRPAAPEDQQATLDIHNRLHFDAPPVTLEEYRRWIVARPHDALLERWVAEVDGEVVGALELEDIWEVEPRGEWEIFLEVHEAWRGRGIGSRLHDFLMERAAALGARELYCKVREDMPESLAFAEKRGFRLSGRVQRQSRLAVKDACLDGFEGVEDRLGLEGIRVATLAEIGMDDKAFMRALHAMSEGTMLDIPHSQGFQPRPFEHWVQNTLLFPGNSPETTWVALHGELPVGLARLRRRGEDSAGNAYTCVDRTYRGRGIARALKLRTVRWAQENGIRYIYTGNDLENRRMLDINVRLGYQPLPGSIEVMKELASSQPG